jgi:16S rRNA processing protein RimM
VVLGARLPLGVLGRPHGVRGELVFRSYNPDGTRLEDLDLPLEVELRPRTGPPRLSQVVAARPFQASGQTGSLIKLAGVNDRDQAAAFTNSELCVPRALLPPLDEGEFYVADLIGCQVTDTAGRSRGVVKNFYWNGSQDILEIHDADGNELLIPVVEDFIRDMDLAARTLVIDDHE